MYFRPRHLLLAFFVFLSAALSYAASSSIECAQRLELDSHEFARNAVVKHKKWIQSHPDLFWKEALPIDTPIKIYEGDLLAPIRKIYNVILKYKMAGKLETLDSMRQAFYEIDPEAARLTDQILNEENLVVVMRRLHSLKLQVEEYQGEFYNLFYPERESPTLEKRITQASIRRPNRIEWGARAFYSTQFLRPFKERAESSSDYGRLMPKHAALLFKKLPRGVSFLKSYEGQNPSETFGGHTYSFSYQALKNRSLITLGDFTNRVYENTRRAMTESSGREVDPERFEGFDSIGFEGMILKGLPEKIVKEKIPLKNSYPASDLRALYIDIFVQLASGERTLSWPFNEVIELVIFGKLSVDEAETYHPSYGFSLLNKEEELKSFNRLKKGHPGLLKRLQFKEPSVAKEQF